MYTTPEFASSMFASKPKPVLTQSSPGFAAIKSGNAALLEALHGQALCSPPKKRSMDLDSSPPSKRIKSFSALGVKPTNLFKDGTNASNNLKPAPKKQKPYIGMKLGSTQSKLTSNPYARKQINITVSQSIPKPAPKVHFHEEEDLFGAPFFGDNDENVSEETFQSFGMF